MHDCGDSQKLSDRKSPICVAFQSKLLPELSSWLTFLISKNCIGSTCGHSPLLYLWPDANPQTAKSDTKINAFEFILELPYQKTSSDLVYNSTASATINNWMDSDDTLPFYDLSKWLEANFLYDYRSYGMKHTKKKRNMWEKARQWWTCCDFAVINYLRGEWWGQCRENFRWIAGFSEMRWSF